MNTIAAIPAPIPIPILCPLESPVMLFLTIVSSYKLYTALSSSILRWLVTETLHKRNYHRYSLSL
jgi:hypothetical protein